MEFKFRAGEGPSYPCPPSNSNGFLTTQSLSGERPCSASLDFFETQALRGGYLGSNHQGAHNPNNSMILHRELDKEHIRRKIVEEEILRMQELHKEHIQERIIEEEILRKQDFYKENIRQKIIAEEVLRREELEDEVRHELALEREMALQGRGGQFFIANSRPLPMVKPLHPEQERVLLPAMPQSWPQPRQIVRDAMGMPLLGRDDSRVVQRFPIVSEKNAIVERLSPMQRLPHNRGTEIQKIPEHGSGRVVFLGKSAPASNLAGSKRKVTAELTSSKKLKHEWHCSLCEVSTTSQQDLNHHQRGKKHKSKVEELRASQPEEPKKAIKTKLVKKGEGTSRQRQQTGQFGVVQDKQQQKGSTFYCKHCNVSCNSERKLEEHLGGKKHLGQLKLDMVVPTKN